ncbi:MAG: ParB/RepB/Spo0J family partition protein [Candidatus Paceibacteria bacterium]
MLSTQIGGTFTRLFVVYTLFIMSFTGDSIFWVEVEKVVPNPYQPRREFDENRLQELAESVRMYGILQPLTVTRKEVQNHDGSFRSEYELIAGERRLRASKLAGLTQVPVIIRDGEQTEQEKLELAIIENLQREDLNAVDRALAFRQLADVFGLSHTQVAKKMGRSREYVSNSVRLLMLPDYMLNSLRAGDISEGHARTLLMLNDRPEEQDTLFRETLLKKLSVREVERIARGIALDKVRKKETVNVELLDLERQFTETLGTRVSIIKTDFGGKLTIDYFDEDDLTKLLEQMKQEGKFHNALPAQGSMREEMTLLEDKEAKTALESLTDATGIMATEANDVPSIAKEDDESLLLQNTNEEPVPLLAASDQLVPEVSPTVPVPELGDTEDSYEVEEISVIEEVLNDKQLPTEVVNESTAPSNPEVKESEVINPLKAQLASLLGNFEPASNSVVSELTEEKKVMPTSNIQTSPQPQSLVRNSPSVDESDLYSINKFTI